MKQGKMLFWLARLALTLAAGSLAVASPAFAVLEPGTLHIDCERAVSASDQRLRCVSGCFYDQTKNTHPVGGNRIWICPGSDQEQLCDVFNLPGCHNRDSTWCHRNGPPGYQLTCPLQDTEDPDRRLCALDEMFDYEIHDCVPRTDNPGSGSSSRSGGENKRGENALIAGAIALTGVILARTMLPELPDGAAFHPHANVDFRNGLAYTTAGLSAEWRNWSFQAGSSNSGLGWSRPWGRVDWRVEWAF